MSELKSQGQLNALNKGDLVALVLQLQESYVKKLEEIAAQNKAAIEEAKVADVIELKAAIERKETEVKTAEAALENAKKLLEERDGEILQLNTLLAKAEKGSKAEADVIQIGEASYTMTVNRFKYQGQFVSAEVLKSNSQLAETLVKEGCAFLKVVNE